MNAWRLAGRTDSSPSRLARSAPPLHGYGFDCLPLARQEARKRLWIKVSGTAHLWRKRPKQAYSSGE